MTTIYVGNLPFTATEDEVRSLFERHGKVESVKLINDRETGRPRGFAFVDMAAGDAQNAIQQTNGFQMGGRPLRVNEAQERAPRSKPARAVAAAARWWRRLRAAGRILSTETALPGSRRPGRIKTCGLAAGARSASPHVLELTDHVDGSAFSAPAIASAARKLPNVVCSTRFQHLIGHEAALRAIDVGIALLRTAG